MPQVFLSWVQSVASELSKVRSRFSKESREVFTTSMKMKENDGDENKTTNTPDDTKRNWAARRKHEERHTQKTTVDLWLIIVILQEIIIHSSTAKSTHFQSHTFQCLRVPAGLVDAVSLYRQKMFQRGTLAVVLCWCCHCLICDVPSWNPRRARPGRTSRWENSAVTKLSGNARR